MLWIKVTSGDRLFESVRELWSLENVVEYILGTAVIWVNDVLDLQDLVWCVRSFWWFYVSEGKNEGTRYCVHKHVPSSGSRLEYHSILMQTNVWGVRKNISSLSAKNEPPIMLPIYSSESRHGNDMINADFFIRLNNFWIDKKCIDCNPHSEGTLYKNYFYQVGSNFKI